MIRLSIKNKICSFWHENEQKFDKHVVSLDKFGSQQNMTLNWGRVHKWSGKLEEMEEGEGYDRICVCCSFLKRNLQEMENGDDENARSLQGDEERDEITAKH